MNTRLLFLLMCSTILVTSAGCSRKIVSVPVASNIAKPDDYMDLEPEWKLRIVVPLLKSGGFRPAVSGQQTDGNTMSMSAEDLLGYEVSHYVANGKSASRVRLVFVSAEATRDGKTVPEAHAPALPFALPPRHEHIRLVYLVRVSKADHNMAIVAAKRPDALNAFTKRLRRIPAFAREKKREFFVPGCPQALPCGRKNHEDWSFGRMP
jgi:hypothetical protein